MLVSRRGHLKGLWAVESLASENLPRSCRAGPRRARRRVRHGCFVWALLLARQKLWVHRIPLASLSKVRAQASGRHAHPRAAWGTAWGEGGYVRLARGAQYNPSGQCGILIQGATYPTGPLTLHNVQPSTATASPSRSPSSTGLPSSSGSPGAPPTYAAMQSATESAVPTATPSSPSSRQSTSPLMRGTPALDGGGGGIIELFNVAAAAASDPGAWLRTPPPLAVLNAEPRLMWFDPGGGGGGGYDLECVSLRGG